VEYINTGEKCGIMNRFLKNNYYDGKHLSTESFKSEQAYNAAKLAQMSRVIFGSGVICGFKVSAMKHYHDAIEIGSGAAVDNEGRLITIYDKIILPVMAIDGFKASEKRHTLRAVYRETRESDDVIAEQCAFTYNEQKGVELADITFENGAVTGVRDARIPADSQLLKSLAKKSISIQENYIEERINRILEKILPLFVKHVLIEYKKSVDESEKRIFDASKEYTNKIYNAMEKTFEAVFKKIKDLDEGLEKIKGALKTAARASGADGLKGSAVKNNEWLD